MRFLCVIAVLICCTGLAQAATTYELEAKTFIDRASERYFNFYNQIAEKVYADALDDFESAFSALTTTRKIASELVQLSEEARKFDLKRIQNEDTKRALKNLYLAADLFILGDDYFSSILINLSALKALANDKDISPYLDGTQGSNDGPLAYYPDIRQIYQKSNNSAELKYYWTTWREKNVLWCSVNFYTIVDAISRAAKLLEMDPLDFWFRFYGNKTFIKDMERVMNEIKPHYQDLHALIRYELHKKYGSDIIDPVGPIPDHLFQQVLDQTWKNTSIFEAYFPFEELPPYNKLVESYDAKSLIKEADKFYTGLGFKPLDDHFYTQQLKEYYDYSTHDNDYKDSGNCRADIFDLTPQVYMLYCQKVDFRKFMQNHGYLARIHYALEKKNLPAYFFNTYDLEYPIGEAVILSASTPKHLKKSVLAKSFNFTDKKAMNRLLRMGINSMLQIPLNFVHTKVLADLLDGTVEFSELNKHYWNLMVQYAGVEPPLHRPEGSMDFPYTFYVDIDQNLQTKKFVSEILGYQFYRALCKNNSVKEPLHFCDFSEDPTVGEKIRNMMRLGSSKPWREVISKVLDQADANISGNALLEYYAPMLDWVRTINSANTQKPGWTNTKKKVL